MINWYNRILDKEWDVSPAGGLTGDAFVAEKEEKRLFLKRNSSPFLAVLSAEGIVPKLVWTKRMENGDVITAQKWLEGRKLYPEEMKSNQVIKILHKIHHSSELLLMLMRIGKRPKTADNNYKNLKEKLTNSETRRDQEVERALGYMKKLLPSTRDQKQVVCHCDLNHNNFILTKDNDLYLVDWESAMIADPVKDFGAILYRYVKRDNWEDWLDVYGVSKSKHLLERMYWYLIYDALSYLHWHEERDEIEKALACKEDIQLLNEQIKTSILV